MARGMVFAFITLVAVQAAEYRDVNRTVPLSPTGIVTIVVTVHNQRNELVLTGEQKYLLRKRNPST